MSKFMTGFESGRQTVAIHIFPNISRKKGFPLKTIIFSQLMKYNMRNIFLEKSHTQCGEETIPRPFSKK